MWALSSFLNILCAIGSNRFSQLCCFKTGQVLGVCCLERKAFLNHAIGLDCVHTSVDVFIKQTLHIFVNIYLTYIFNIYISIYIYTN